MNNIELANKCTPIIDMIYKEESKTEMLDSRRFKFTGVNEVKILTIDIQGIGEYNRITGYPQGGVLLNGLLTHYQKKGKPLYLLTVWTMKKHYTKQWEVP